MPNNEYTIQAASPAISGELVRFFEEFYAITDDPSEIENYVDQFTADAVFIRGGAEPTRGADEIRTWRKHAFDYMKSCKHIPHKMFSLGPESNEVMLYGQVTIGHLNSQISMGGYAVRAILEKDRIEQKWRLAYYEVFMDVQELSKAGAL
ncbi:unnamed protein product [Clonostachys rosea]|uniref:SnoaL-like domain-containing protein n=1 Tax=Bionectria ochroleuca TaxID=29856 RepID=A0ABY6UQW9_BIOOC|nr:unnamed protein product [Clonostachys rosea]